MAYTSQPIILPGSDNTSVGSINCKGAGRDFILNPTINVNFPPPPTDHGATMLDLITSRLMNALGFVSQPGPTGSTSAASEIWQDTRSNQDREHTRPDGPSSQGECVKEDFKVTPVEELERPASSNMTTPQVYVSNMLRSGLGLACWRPKPYSGTRGGAPGDVGIYTADGGFKRIFNFWDDDAAIRDTARGLRIRTYTTPERNVKFAENEFHQGDTVMHGATSEMKEKYSDAFEFQCRGPEGAVLALTSAADLEELDGHAHLREHVCKHAELVYRHANRIRRIGDEESLYIVTGCIKSDTYALAAYQEFMEPPDHVLKLVRREAHLADGYSKLQPPYAWIRRGAAQTRTGVSERPGVKDQSLFLRGFKLDFSLSFRYRMVTTARSDSDGARSDRRSNSHAPHGHGSDRSHHHEHLNSGGSSGGGSHSGERGRGGFHLSQRDETNGSSETGQPTGYGRRVTCHPCDTITRYLLKVTSADFALSHDDDWRFLVASEEADGSCKGEHTTRGLPVVVMRHGGTFLEMEEPNKLCVSNSESEPLPSSFIDSVDRNGIGYSPPTEYGPAVLHSGCPPNFSLSEKKRPVLAGFSFKEGAKDNSTPEKVAQQADIKQTEPALHSLHKREKACLSGVVAPFLLKFVKLRDNYLLFGIVAALLGRIALSWLTFNEWHHDLDIQPKIKVLLDQTRGEFLDRRPVPQVFTTVSFIHPLVLAVVHLYLIFATDGCQVLPLLPWAVISHQSPNVSSHLQAPAGFVMLSHSFFRWLTHS